MSHGMLLAKRRRVESLETELALLQAGGLVKVTKRYRDGAGKVRSRSAMERRQPTKRELRRIEVLKVEIPKAQRRVS